MSGAKRNRPDSREARPAKSLSHYVAYFISKCARLTVPDAALLAVWILLLTALAQVIKGVL